MRRLHLIAIAAASFLLPLGTLADEPKDKKVDVSPLRELSAKGLKFQEGGKVTMPTVVKSAKELAKIMPDEADQARVNKEVNWDKQFVLAFSWGGSGQDQVTSDITKGKDEIVFRHMPGKTRDFRMHTRLYVVRQGVTWKFEK